MPNPDHRDPFLVTLRLPSQAVEVAQVASARTGALQNPGLGNENGDGVRFAKSDSVPVSSARPGIIGLSAGPSDSTTFRFVEVADMHIPEPSTFVRMSLAGCGLLYGRRRKRC